MKEPEPPAEPRPTDPESEQEPMQYCPLCSTRLISRKCKLICTHRFRQMIAEENPKLGAFHQDAWARNLDYARRQPKQALDSFRRVRSENYDLLKALPESAFDRTGVHSERGPLSLMQLLET